MDSLIEAAATGLVLMLGFGTLYLIVGIIIQWVKEEFK